MSEAYDALLLSDSKANGAAKAINNITDYQIDNIVTKKNKDIISKVRNAKFMKGNSFINLTKEHICPCNFESVDDALKDIDEKIKSGEVIRYFELR